jgi:hypothetical protein
MPCHTAVCPSTTVHFAMIHVSRSYTHAYKKSCIQMQAVHRVKPSMRHCYFVLLCSCHRWCFILRSQRCSSCCTLILPSFLGAPNWYISICGAEPHPRSQTVLFISIVSQLIYRYGPRAQRTLAKAEVLIYRSCYLLYSFPLLQQYVEGPPWLEHGIFLLNSVFCDTYMWISDTPNRPQICIATTVQTN